MRQAHDTSSRNRRHKSTPFFWRRFMVRVSSRSWTGFFQHQIPALIRTLFYSKPESGVRVTEMMTCDWSMIIVDVLRCRRSCFMQCSYLFIYLIFQTCLFTAPEIFIPDANRTKNRRRKLAPKIGARKWGRFMAPVSGACVRGLRPIFITRLKLSSGRTSLSESRLFRCDTRETSLPEAVVAKWHRETSLTNCMKRYERLIGRRLQKQTGEMQLNKLIVMTSVTSVTDSSMTCTLSVIFVSRLRSSRLRTSPSLHAELTLNLSFSSCFAFSDLFAAAHSAYVI